MSARARPGLWVMEAAWSTDVTDIRSVDPVLRALDDAKVARFARLPINDREDFIEQMKRWGQAKHSRFGIAYVAMHGSPGSVYAGRSHIDLEDVAQELPKGALAGKVIYFGSCSVLRRKATREVLPSAFGVKAVTGFTKEVDWFESLAFELLLFDALSQYQRMSAVQNYIERTCGDLSRRLGFVALRI